MFSNRGKGLVTVVLMAIMIDICIYIYNGDSMGKNENIWE